MQYVSFADTPLSVDELNPHTWVLMLDAPVTPDDTARLGRALDEAAPPGVNLLVWDEADDDPRAAIAQAGGWRRQASKAFVEGDLGRVPPVSIPDGWRLQTLAELGEEEFSRRMFTASEGDPFSPSTAQTALADLRDLIAFAEDAFEPEEWFAVSDGEPVGVLLPQVYPDKPLEGTIFYVGVAPERRGQGFGSRLHQLGLAMLRERGAVRYVGSTDERNLPMLKVFEKAGVRVVRRQTFYHRPPQTR